MTANNEISPYDLNCLLSYEGRRTHFNRLAIQNLIDYTQPDLILWSAARLLQGCYEPIDPSLLDELQETFTPELTQHLSPATIEIMSNLHRTELRGASLYLLECLIDSTRQYYLADRPRENALLVSFMDDVRKKYAYYNEDDGSTGYDTTVRFEIIEAEDRLEVKAMGASPYGGTSYDWIVQDHIACFNTISDS